MADDVYMTLAGLDEALTLLGKTVAFSEGVMQRTNFRVSTRIRDRAKTYAPRSPTVGDRVKAGHKPDNFIAPSDLSDFERSHLRDAFVVVRTMQSAIGSTRGARS
jgi:hypothetical protein